MTENAIVAPEQAISPLTLLEKAISSNADLDRLQKLMEMYSQWEAGNARKAFFAALATFQATCPVITKNRKVDFANRNNTGRTQYEYADLGQIVEQIKKPLQDSGLAYQWRIAETGTRIQVTTILTHKGGHSEEYSMSALADNTGNKSSIQQSGSTVTYLQRYTLIGALGIATAQSDTDGEGPVQVPKPPGQQPVEAPVAQPEAEPETKPYAIDEEILNNITLCTSVDELHRWASGLEPELKKNVAFRRAVAKHQKQIEGRG